MILLQLRKPESARRRRRDVELYHFTDITILTA